MIAANCSNVMQSTARTDRTVSAINSTVRDSKHGTCMSVDVATAADRNVIQTEAEETLKYKDLTIEVQCMWNVKGTAVYR